VKVNNEVVSPDYKIGKDKTSGGFLLRVEPVFLFTIISLHLFRQVWTTFMNCALLVNSSTFGKTEACKKPQVYVVTSWLSINFMYEFTRVPDTKVLVRIQILGSVIRIVGPDRDPIRIPPYPCTTGCKSPQYFSSCAH
jgi:hypothetical protein